MKDIEIIVGRCIEHFSKGIDLEDAKRFSESIRPDGSFEDLDYISTPEDIWKAMVHFTRLSRIAMLNEFDKVEKGIEFWFSEERVCRNWWWNDIGLPLKCYLLALLLKDKGSFEAKTKLAGVFNTDIAPEWTGANKCWLAQNIIIRGLMTDDLELVIKGKNYLEETIYISEDGEEGIQSDYAFAQHGAQLYNNGYGLSFLKDNCLWMRLLSGTKAGFLKEKVQILTNLLLEGNRYMMYRDVYDFNTVGRDVVRGYSSYNDAQKIIETADALYNETKRAEISEFRDFVTKKARTPGFVWTKYFKSLNFMTHLRQGYYASTRFGSKGVLGGDICDGKAVNGEDLLAGFGGCFLTHYLVDGDEYKDIFPVWNWGLLPGVTSPEVELPIELGVDMKSSFATGSADGKYGVCAIDLSEEYEFDEKVKFGGRKACFYFDNEIIHLGCELYSTSKKPFNTTLNQCFLKGEVLVDGIVCEKGKREIDARAVWHNKINYILKDKAVLKNDCQTGSYAKVKRGGDESEITRDIFTLYLPHKDNSSYAFAVLPDTSPEQGASYEFPEIINTASHQAVIKDGKIYAVFYEKGEIITDTVTVKADKPCIIIKDL